MTLDVRPQKLGILAAIGQTLRPVRRMAWPQQRRLSIRKKLVFALIANLLVFLLLTIAGETLVRVRHGTLARFGRPRTWYTEYTDTTLAVYHPEFGYILRANAQRANVKTDSEGLRTNGNPGTPPGPPI